ncbi:MULTISPECIES: CheR family methyltransferase [Halocynthiibacter]|uniref:Chemotaxis protein methyltransferase n=1 Tax=Halocynthiibacter halioticoli TaxID=2986804 RepID=A0AAE3J0Y1_9RHOB|nr:MULTISPECIES: protein-glutamate O-methyltransferase CheR [Halocynthiibacter]MCV6824483.1 protein-glutamate O-methyltransferase CheR [Halocynthiibacter halioticoli]MCW4057484.1 protein-glutamate O-methyltransferase CheR [Halocynthiibacter sp. SDUM655004]
MSKDQFLLVSKLAKQNAGLMFPDTKASLVSSRLLKRLRILKLQNFEQYCDLLCGNNAKEEIHHMVAALTTNISSFFREKHHFETLGKEILPTIIEHATKGGKIRIWSAGCSVGMEAYSIAMTIHEGFPEVGNCDVKILATDIDPNVLEIARLGEYQVGDLTNVSKAHQDRYFRSSETETKSSIRVVSEIQNLVSFKQLNLIENWPIKGHFDIIFCRNTVIYFDEDTQKQLWSRFQNILHEGGWLFVGHSERVQENSAPLLKSRGMTIYQKSSETGEKQLRPRSSEESQCL